MRKTLLAMTCFGLLGAGAMSIRPALAGPTPEQQAAEWLEQAPGSSSSSASVSASIAASGNPANASNGMAQQRIFQQQEQQLEH